MTREEVLERLNSVINVNGHILVVASGNGMSSQYVIEGGADLITAISAGRFRQMGQSAYSAFFGCTDTNQMVLDYVTKEILTLANDFPVVLGLFAQDPCIHLYEHLQIIKEYGYAGIINYPSVCLFDGNFRTALEEAGLGFDKEVEAIRLAHYFNLFTVAYVLTEEEAVAMAKAGADVICLHFGITGGGILGANKIISMEVALKRAESIFHKIDKVNPNIIKIISGGPVKTPIDAHAFYQNTSCHGYLGGSAIERLPVERSMLNTVRAFKSPGDFDSSNIVNRVLNGTQDKPEYADFMLEYIEKNYEKCIRLKDLANVTHISTTRLSVLFKEKTGKSFTQYLIEFRMNMAKELLRNTDKQMKEIALIVGYDDYAQFSKMFRKMFQISPQEYRKIHNE